MIPYEHSVKFVKKYIYPVHISILRLHFSGHVYHFLRISVCLSLLLSVPLLNPSVVYVSLYLTLFGLLRWLPSSPGFLSLGPRPNEKLIKLNRKLHCPPQQVLHLSVLPLSLPLGEWETAPLTLMLSVCQLRSRRNVTRSEYRARPKAKQKLITGDCLVSG